MSPCRSACAPIRCKACCYRVARRNSARRFQHSAPAVPAAHGVLHVGLRRDAAITAAPCASVTRRGTRPMKRTPGAARRSNELCSTAL
ncbi:hypothetical protein BURMUCF2_3448 [Burkholderia multivorans CF2]|nr:hypothetical protein BURMUCF2_3448 [Burkholderia multivorans CF2]